MGSNLCLNHLFPVRATCTFRLARRGRDGVLRQVRAVHVCVYCRSKFRRAFGLRQGARRPELSIVLFKKALAEALAARGL